MEVADVFGVPVCIHKLETLDCDYVRERMDVNETHHEPPIQPYVELPAEVQAEILEKTLYFSQKVLGHKIDEVQFSALWGNITKENTEIQEHHHSNSYLSGCFYLTEGSSINFHDPIRPNHMYMISPETNYDPTNKYTWQTMNLPPEPGRLIIFPSGLAHSVNKSYNRRYSIAYNVMPKGMMGIRTTQLDIGSYD